jgi:multidrug efflux pump subunit AcrA (membrane-fusion protein)
MRISSARSRSDAAVLDGLTAILTIGKHGGDWRPPVALHGLLPEGMDPAILQDACGDRPSLRKIGTNLALVFPEGSEAWVIWLLDHVPPVTALPDLVERLGRLTRDLRGSAAAQSGPETGQGPGSGLGTDLVGAMLSRLAGSQKRDAASVAQMLADGLVEHGVARLAIVAQLRGRGRVRLSLSDARLAPLADEWRHAIRTHLGEAPQRVELSQDDLSDAGLEGALLADMSGAQRVVLDLPARDAGGLALILCDPAEASEGLRAQVDALAALAVGRKPPQPMRKGLWRAVAGVAAVAAVVWLVLPAPLVVTAIAVSEARGAVAVALPVAGFVDQISVRVGDQLAPGDALARFRAPDLEEENATLGIELAMEGVAAQTALSTNDYGAFLLSQQKIDAARLRQSRVQERLAALDMKAPLAGRVVLAMAPDSAGRYLPIGETVAVIHPTDQFSVTLTVSRVDAPLLVPGQEGEVWFRGISGQSWPLRIDTPVMHIRAPEGGGAQLTLRAQITAPDQQALFAGLAGFARVTAGEQMRARVFSRYVTEYVRGKAWIWFGLMF